MTPMNPALDLELTRLMEVPPERVWRCWTEADLLKQWWAPKPVTTRHAEIDLRPGGRFHTVMVLPDGTDHPTDGCILEVVPARRLIFTDALEAGYRPATTPMFGFTAIIALTPEAGGTRYHARAMHKSREIRDQHEAMGFHAGWGAAAAQLEALARGLS